MQVTIVLSKHTIKTMTLGWTANVNTIMRWLPYRVTNILIFHCGSTHTMYLCL